MSTHAGGWVTVCLISLAVIGMTACKRSTHAAASPPVVEVAQVETRDVPVYGEWIGTLTGQVNANIKTQVTGYHLTKNYKEGSYVTKGQLLFQIDPRPFHDALDQAKGQLALAQAQLV